MKNVFFVFFFMSIGTFSFANTGEVDSKSEEIEVLDQNILQSFESLDTQVLEDACTSFTLSCGVTGQVCGDNLESMVNAVLLADYIVCDLLLA